MTPRTERAPGSSFPVTPSKNRLNAAEFDLWFLEFSNTYNLNLRRSPSDLSPQKKRALPYYSDLQYYELLKVQYFKGKHLVIHELFDHGAKSIHSKWVEKPRTVLGVTPYPTHLPRATTEPERCRLLELLKAILEDVSSTNVSSRSSVASSFSHQAYDEPTSPTRSWHFKRHSNERNGNPFKRTRSFHSEVDTECDPDDDDERPPSVLSVLDRGRVLSASPVPSRVPSVQPLNKMRPDLNRSFYGLPSYANESKSTFQSEVFSDHGPYEIPPITQGTQTTVMASNPEYMKLPVLRSIESDSESFAPSSSTERALQISFDRHEQLKGVGEILRDESSMYSDVSSILHVEPHKIHHPAPTLPPRSLPPLSIPPASLMPPPPLERETDDTSLPVVRTGTEFEQRLYSVWPILPDHFDQAPFVVRWEIMRIALHCGIQMDNLHAEYDPSWTEQKTLWARLQALPAFQGKNFPEKSRPEAWTAALNDKFCTKEQAVVLTASLATNTSRNGPLFTLKLNPLKLDLPHRLSRRFGSDRFIELVIPSIGSQELKCLGEPSMERIQQWLVNGSHRLLGRLWKSFFVKPSLPKKISNENTLMPQTKTIYQERVYLFAEDGNDFRVSGTGSHWPPKGEPVGMHTKLGREGLLDWLLQIPNNQKQSILKLFSRIALGLSRTHPTVVLQPDQIRHRPEDILSPTNKVMNDGIARMSYGLARAIRDAMGLQDVPAGFQGRFGCAKGFWIRDATDTSDDIWIETTPSQRKWNCDYAEEDHRTFEVRRESKELKYANLNLQLLPILEDRAINATLMKTQVGAFLRDSLKKDLDAQKAAMQDPTQFKLWVYENSPSSRRAERVKNEQVPFTAGLPSGREDIMSFLLDSGFSPTKLRFLRDIALKLRREKCEELHERLNVKVGCSTNAYMVVDFLGILEEDEVHLGFSSKFTDEQSGFSETFLHGMDVLVARTPAHYPSDIQRVKAVFKPELGRLKDVIIFSTKGNIPLAEKLSGGDYDGDIAWVCWEPSIVNNFQNAEMPVVPDLFAQDVVRKESETYLDLVGARDITSEFLAKAFRFNMQQNLLGMCTNYKERLCYARNSVGDETAILLSTLISHLVDRAKQGIVFTDEDWARLRKRLSRHDPPNPRYKNKEWDVEGAPQQIIDYVKFSVGNPTIEMEMKSFTEALGKAEQYDEDLVKFYNHYEDIKRAHAVPKEFVKKSTWETILNELRNNIDAVAQEWAKTQGDWNAKVANIYDKWQEIRPTNKVNSRTIKAWQQEDQVSTGFSNWDLLKASFCFKLYYNRYPGLIWNIAGKQLAYLKALAVSNRTGASPVMVIPTMYAGLRPDNKYARALAARTEGRYLAEGEDDH
ncbi:RNA dependent RNA polymerase-domain-containing protein [Hypoxylon fragiforme]|uniref:RNA dependent RNA polymerase-domain-containing protein n=1 Tax=Hypoxylon fragiforme TaxID=63214 RepID=UPI0020C71E72|nr:RNA dependent RNA polymerase-domain-containing protein [Hypoxylon fragiforme]KAI2612210.1 RNA dependent RNA polymerase-domain-containing protein [Hypoxylon fragiforme]